MENLYAKKSNKIIFICLIILLSIILCLPQVNADMGPKPRATISVVGTENLGMYHVKIFASGGISNRPESQESAYKFVDDYEIDGYDESFVFCDLQGDFVYDSSYIAHDNYQIVIFSENGDTIFCSPMFEREFFEGFYTYNLGGKTFQEITESLEDNSTIYGSVSAEYKWWYIVVSTFGRMLVTVAVECLIALVLFRNKRVIKIIAITNIITNYALNQTLSIIDLVTGFQMMNYMMLYWAFEIVVILIESLVYCKTMPLVSKLKIILYTIVANLITFVLGMAVGLGIYQAVF